MQLCYLSGKLANLGVCRINNRKAGGKITKVFMRFFSLFLQLISHPRAHPGQRFFQTFRQRGHLFCMALLLLLGELGKLGKLAA